MSFVGGRGGVEQDGRALKGIFVHFDYLKIGVYIQRDEEFVVVYWVPLV